MDFKTTTMLLEAIQPYIENSDVNITTENKDWRNHNYKYDFVNIDA